jgi:hypothetical protein
MADGAALSVNSAEQAAEATEPVQAEETAEEAVGGKRKRRSKLEKAEDDVKANKELQETTEGQLTVLTAQGVLDSRARAKLKKVTEKLATLRARLPELVAALEKIKEEKAQETARAEARAAQEKEKAELSRAIGDASLLTLTELRLKKDSEFDNTVDRSDAIWARILAEYNSKCTCNELPIDDKIETVAGARRGFDREMGEFRQWAQIANRAVNESGVPAEEVEDKVKAHYRITTSLFIKHGWWERPMSIPPTQISGDTAAVGGVENVLGGGGVPPVPAAAAAEEEEEEDAILATLLHPCADKGSLGCISHPMTHFIPQTLTQLRAHLRRSLAHSGLVGGVVTVRRLVHAMIFLLPHARRAQHDFLLSKEIAPVSCTHVSIIIGANVCNEKVVQDG